MVNGLCHSVVDNWHWFPSWWGWSSSFLFRMTESSVNNFACDGVEPMSYRENGAITKLASQSLLKEVMFRFIVSLGLCLVIGWNSKQIISVPYLNHFVCVTVNCCSCLIKNQHLRLALGRMAIQKINWTDYRLSFCIPKSAHMNSVDTRFNM